MANAKPLLQLVADGQQPAIVTVGSLTPNACAIRVLRSADLRPVRGIEVVFQVADGPLLFAGDRAKAKVVTDEWGRASVSATFETTGSAVVTVRPVNAKAPVVRLVLHSFDLTASVAVDAPFVVDADNSFDVHVICRDGRGLLVSSPKVHRLIGNHMLDLQRAFRTKRVSAGHLSCSVRLRDAGIWALSATDERTGITGSTTVTIAPAQPARIRVIGTPDPRREPPYEQVLVRARLEDRFGNPLDPGRLFATVGASPESLRVVRDEAQVLIANPEISDSSVTLADRESDLVEKVDIWFAPAWLQVPAWMEIGSRFTTKLYLNARRSPKLHRATIFTDFNPELCSFETFRPSTQEVALSVEHSRARVRVDVSAERSRRIPEGTIELGALDWRCKGEGRTCFRVRARMSPTERGWTLCAEQKRAKPACICINVIWLKSDADAGRRGVEGAYRFAELVSEQRNVGACCPVLQVQVTSNPVDAGKLAKIKDSMDSSLGNYNFAWQLKLPPRDDIAGSIEANSLEIALDGQNLWRKECHNIIMIPFPQSDKVPALAFTKRYKDENVPVKQRGYTVADPQRIAGNPNVIAHEIGHALGLEDRTDDQGMLMYHKAPQARSYRKRNAARFGNISTALNAHDQIGSFALTLSLSLIQRSAREATRASQAAAPT